VNGVCKIFQKSCRLIEPVINLYARACGQQSSVGGDNKTPWAGYLHPRGRNIHTIPACSSVGRRRTPAQVIKQIPERPGDGAVGELAAASDGGEAAQRGAGDQPASPVESAEERSRSGRHDRRERAGAALAARGHGRAAADQRMPGHIGEVGRGAELRGRMHGPQCERAHGIERVLRSHGDDAGLERDGQAAAGDAGKVGRGGDDHQGHEYLAAGRKAADRHRRDAEDRADQLQRCAGAWLRQIGRLDAHRAVAGGIRIGEGVVVDIGIAVPGLAVERVAHHRVGAEHAADIRIVDPPVEVHDADVGQELLAGEAADGLADDAVDAVVER